MITKRGVFTMLWTVLIVFGIMIIIGALASYEFLGILFGVGLVIFSVWRKKKHVPGIKKAASYQHFLEVMELLKHLGYEVNEFMSKDFEAQASVDKNGEPCGVLFVVSKPGLISWLISLTSLGDWSANNKYIGICELARSKGGSSYYPEGSFVGGFTTKPNQNDKWFKIIAQTIR